ncbi:hypothetical protein [Brevifollis gellanilyticus]|uniref:hypothetical protein n=1 Tax=Brevifollis gellanilyticus TaxID=748831 RepID=UPI0011BD7ED2|nr:hypothetical protein [Brevifollis gellanilyticus]
MPPATADSFTRFGAQVILAGNRLAVGDAHFNETGHVGRVYVYEKQGSIWPDQPAYVIEPSQPDLSSFGQGFAFSGEYLAVTELVRLDSTQSLVRVRSYRLQNGQATLLGEVERAGGDHFGFEMSMNGSELAILNLHKGMVLQSSKGDVLFYELSGGTMNQTATLPIPMAKGDLFYSPIVRLEGDRLLVTKCNSPSAWGVFFKRTATGWRVSSEVRFSQTNEASTYLADMAGSALVVNGRQGTDLYLASEPPQFVRRLEAGYPYALATTSETAMIVRGERLLFTPLRSLLAADSLVLDPAEATPPGGGIYLGELVAGQPCNAEIELQNSSTNPLHLTGVNITPVQGANSLTGHSFTPVTLPPLGKARVKLTLTPPSAGDYRLSLEALHPDSAQAPYVYKIDFQARSGDFAPFVSEGMLSMLIAKGEPVKLQADAAGPRGRFNCQWYKEGRALPGSTLPYLYIPSAQPAHAGRYRLDVWSTGSARMSCLMNLGVFEKQSSVVVANPSDSLSFTARFWGPGIRVRWLYPYVGAPTYTESWAMQGTQTATLTIPSVMALSRALPLRVAAELTMDETATALASDHMIEVLRVPIIAATGSRVGQVGYPFGVIMLSDLTDLPEGPVFSAEGLPPGVQLTQQGYRIEGTPTQAGDYSVKIMAENRFGSALPYILKLKIFSATEEPNVKLHFGTPHKTAGIIMIPEPNTETPAWPGLLQVVTTNGTGFSGSLAFGTVHRPFAGQWNVSTADATRSVTLRLASFLGYRSVLLIMDQYATEESFPSNGISARLMLEYGSAEGGTSEQTAALEPLFPLNKDWRHTLAGRYSFLMGGLAGQGFGTFTVGSDFQATGAGTLADGTGFTFSAPMYMGQNGVSNGTLMLVRLGSGPVRLWGRINTQGSSTEETGLVDGTLMMARPAQPGARLLPEGYNTEVPVRGGRYFVPKDIPFFTPPDASAEQIGRTNINIAADGMPEGVQTGLTFTKAGGVLVDQPNTSNLKLDVYKPTGFFTGTFKVNEPVPGAEDRFVRRTVSFRGMVIPQRRIGGGFLHFSPLPNRFAEPPTTSANTPIYVGGVTLE